MSKVGKRAFLLLLAIPIVINVMAQETKKPTLEDLIPGGESYRYAENLYGLQWWGDECIKPGVDTLYSIQPKTRHRHHLFYPAANRQRNNAHHP
jgi:dipeptidyl-peptidase-4